MINDKVMKLSTDFYILFFYRRIFRCSDCGFVNISNSKECLCKGLPRIASAVKGAVLSNPQALQF